MSEVLGQMISKGQVRAASVSERSRSPTVAALTAALHDEALRDGGDVLGAAGLLHREAAQGHARADDVLAAGLGQRGADVALGHLVGADLQGRGLVTGRD